MRPPVSDLNLVSLNLLLNFLASFSRKLISFQKNRRMKKCRILFSISWSRIRFNRLTLENDIRFWIIESGKTKSLKNARRSTRWGMFQEVFRTPHWRQTVGNIEIEFRITQKKSYNRFCVHLKLFLLYIPLFWAQNARFLLYIPLF